MLFRIFTFSFILTLFANAGQCATEMDLRTPKLSNAVREHDLLGAFVRLARGADPEMAVTTRTNSFWRGVFKPDYFSTPKVERLSGEQLQGALDMAQLLVFFGVDPDMKRHKDVPTFLAMAADHGLIEVVEFLVKNGANPSHSEPVWGTALHRAKGHDFSSRAHVYRDIISLLEESQRNYAHTEARIEVRNARSRQDVLAEWFKGEVASAIATGNNTRRAKFEGLLELIQSPDIKTERALNALAGAVAPPIVRFGTLSRAQEQRRKVRPVIKTSTQAEAEATLPRQEGQLATTAIIEHATSLALLPVAAPSADTYKHWR